MLEMAAPKKVSTCLFLHLVLLLLLPSVFDHVDAHHGLKVGFYKKSCPQAEAITKKVILKSVLGARSLAGPLLRMFFHDCFVRVRKSLVFCRIMRLVDPIGANML